MNTACKACALPLYYSPSLDYSLTAQSYATQHNPSTLYIPALMKEPAKTRADEESTSIPGSREWEGGRGHLVHHFLYFPHTLPDANVKIMSEPALCMSLGW